MAHREDEYISKLTLLDSLVVGATAFAAATLETILNVLNAITASALQINQVCNPTGRFVAGGAGLALTAALHANKTVLFDTAGGTALTLPAATGSGNRYRALVSVIATGGASHTVVTAPLTDFFFGGISTMSDDPATVKEFWAGATDNTITLNRTSTGSVKVGEWLEFEDFAAGKWFVRGNTASTGAEATPFSHT